MYIKLLSPSTLSGIHTHCFEDTDNLPLHGHAWGMLFQFSDKHVIDKVAGTGQLVETEAQPGCVLDK